MAIKFSRMITVSNSRNLLCNQILMALLIYTSSSVAYAGNEMNDVSPPKSFCDKGMFVIDEKNYSFEDIVVEGNRVVFKYEKSKITAYGYIGNLSLATDPRARTQAKFFAGQDCLGPIGLVNPNLNAWIDIIIDPQHHEISEDRYREIRKVLLQSAKGVAGKALLKMSGFFGLYRGSNDFYFHVENAEIISTAEEYLNNEKNKIKEQNQSSTIEQKIPDDYLKNKKISKNNNYDTIALYGLNADKKASEVFEEIKANIPRVLNTPEKAHLCRKSASTIENIFMSRQKQFFSDQDISIFSLMSKVSSYAIEYYLNNNYNEEYFLKLINNDENSINAVRAREIQCYGLMDQLFE